MLTYTGARNLYGELTGSDKAANLSFGDTMINQGVRKMLGDIQWSFLEDEETLKTVSSQQFYELPNDVRKVINVTIDQGTTRYQPSEAKNRKHWDYLNSTTDYDSDIPAYFYIFNRKIGFWPTPSTANLDINLQYTKQVRDISEADYTTGNVTDVTGGSATVTGSGTSWDTNVKPGEYIQIDYPDGDGTWYEIESVDSATQLTLTRDYEGTSISGGSASYTIGDIMVIPEDYHKAPVYYAAAVYWTKEDSARATRFMEMFESDRRDMRKDYGSKTTYPVVDSGFDDMNDVVNPNVTIHAS